MISYQFNLTPAAGKRLIAKAIASYKPLTDALGKNSTIAIIAGTTNGYVAEEILSLINQNEGFDKSRFFRGITLPPHIKTSETGRLPSQEKDFPGDVIITNGRWQKGKTIADVLENLKNGDIIIKGANAVDPTLKKAGILVGNPRGGTILMALQAVTGRRARLIIPVGLEKRVTNDIDEIAYKTNRPESRGWRMLSIGGAEVITEIQAIEILSGNKVRATLIASGGVEGAEGSVLIGIESESEESIGRIKKIADEVAGEPLFKISRK